MHRHAGTYVHRWAADHVGHHARSFGEVDERDGVGLVVVERRRWPVLDDDRVHGGASRGLAMLEAGAEAPWAGDAWEVHEHLAIDAPLQDELLVPRRLPVREACLGGAWLEPGHSVASVPRTIVDMHDRMNPAP